MPNALLAFSQIFPISVSISVADIEAIYSHAEIPLKSSA